MAKLVDLLVHLRPVFRFIIAALLVTTASRLLLIGLHWQRVSDVEGLWRVLLLGVRFDILLIAALGLLPAFFTPLFATHFGSPRFWLPVQRWWFAGSLILILFMEAVTPSFIAEYDLRPNGLFLEYLEYPREVGAMLLKGYKTELLLIPTCVLILGYFLLGWMRSPSISGSLSPVTAIFTSFLILVVGGLTVRSSLGHRPANPSIAAFSQDMLVNDLALPSLYNTLYAAYRISRHEGKVSAYGEMPAATAIALVREQMHVAEEDFVSASLPTLHRQVLVAPERKNLVIILEESLGAEFVGSLGGVGVTPELDQLAETGIWFDNLYATGTRSVRGIEAVITGFTPTPARAVVKLPKAQQGFFTIAELLKRKGFDTSFMYGGEAHFDNMRQFFMGNGFQRIIERKDFVDPKFVGSWGASDEDLFARAHREFSAMGDQPFFSLVFTSSNHSPFEFPEGKIELHEVPQPTVNNAVKYADFALGQFIESARQSNYWENTVFLIVADHNTRVRGSNLVPIEYFHIPALILGGGIEPRRYSRLASQIDLLPTVLSLIGVESEHPAIGRDLLAEGTTSRPGRAIMQYDGTQAYRRGNDVIVMELGKEPRQYSYSRESGLVVSKETDSELLDTAIAHALWSSLAYHKRLYRLPAPDES